MSWAFRLRPVSSIPCGASCSAPSWPARPWPSARSVSSPTASASVYGRRQSEHDESTSLTQPPDREPPRSLPGNPSLSPPFLLALDHSPNLLLPGLFHIPCKPLIDTPVPFEYNMDITPTLSGQKPNREWFSV